MRRMLPIATIVVATVLGVACVAQAQRPSPSVESGAPGDPTTPPATPPPPEVVERLHDIRGPVTFAPPWRVVDYATVAGAALAGVALCLIGWAIVRGRAPKSLPVAEPVPAAHEAALAKLGELRELDLFRQGGREGHLRLATEVPRILKGFLDAVYATGSVYLTTTETHRKTGVAMGLEWGREVSTVLVACDRVKFAGQAALSDDPIPRAERIVTAVADVLAQRSREGRPAA